MYGMYRTHMLLELVQVLGGTLSSLSSVSVYTETSSQTLQHDPRLRQEEGLERTSSPFSLLDVGICSNTRKQ